MKMFIETSKNSYNIVKVLEKSKNSMPRAYVRAANRAVVGMKTDGLRSITDEYTAERKKVEKKIGVVKASMGNMSAFIYSKGRPLRSYYFKHRKNTNPGKIGGKSAFLQVKKKGSGYQFTGETSRYSKVFVTTMPNGIPGLFRRTGKNVPANKVRVGKSRSGYNARTHTLKGREDIEQLYSPGAVQMLNNPEIRRQIKEGAIKRFYKEFDHQVTRELNR